MTEKVILIADDDRAIRTVLMQALSRQGYGVRSTATASTLWNWISEGQGDLIITDVVMPDGNGLDLLPHVNRLRPDLPVIIMSAQNTLSTAVSAMEKGAFDYLPKPFDLSALSEVVARALKPGVVKSGMLKTEAYQGKHSQQKPQEDSLIDYEGQHLIGRSPAMQNVYRIIARLTTTDLAALITGESGTGKELVARALHSYSKRKKGPFVALNMAAIPKDLIESELFGHEKGAFTGATSRMSGRFEQAENGTLFLDEIGDMPLEAQTRLLRVLQEGEYTMVGGRYPIRTNVRIVTATNRDLLAQVQVGQFREDLYYRLAVVPIHLPPLRDRKGDIPDLINYFLQKAVTETGTLKRLSNEALESLASYHWPGNVRELENMINRLIALYSENILDRTIIENEMMALRKPALGDSGHLKNASLSEAIEMHLRDYFDAHQGVLPSSGLYDQVLREMERPLISLSLLATNGNQIKASELLGINRNTLRKKIRELDIQIMRQK